MATGGGIIESTGTLLGGAPVATDFYMFMITRWAPDRDSMLDGRPRLSTFIQSMATT